MDIDNMTSSIFFKFDPLGSPNVGFSQDAQVIS